MQKLSDLDVSAIRLASELPTDTVIIIGKHGITKLYTILSGRSDIYNLIVPSAKEFENLFEPRSDNK